MDVATVARYNVALGRPMDKLRFRILAMPCFIKEKKLGSSFMYQEKKIKNKKNLDLNMKVPETPRKLSCFGVNEINTLREEVF